MNDFIDALAATITVRELATSLEHATCFDVASSEGTVFEDLRQADFDFAPVVDGRQVVGRVARASLDRESDAAIASKVVRLHERIIVSADSPVDRLLEWLEEEHFLLVLDQREVMGLVTVSDLNKQAGRTYMYALVAGLEMAITRLLRSSGHDPTFLLELLAHDRQHVIRDRFQEFGSEAADFIAAMDLSDLLNLIRKTEIYESLGFGSKSQYKKTTGRIVRFRDSVAHSTRHIITSNDEIRALRRAVAAIHDVHGRLPSYPSNSRYSLHHSRSETVRDADADH